MPHCLTKDTWPKSWASKQLSPKPHRPGLRESLTKEAQLWRHQQQLGWPVWALLFRKGGAYGVRSLFCFLPWGICITKSLGQW